jgi:hypothetical protein
MVNANREGFDFDGKAKPIFHSSFRFYIAISVKATVENARR